MNSSVLTGRISDELEVLGNAIVCRDAQRIEDCTLRVSGMLTELGNHFGTDTQKHEDNLQPIVAAADRCSAILRRARLALTALQNLHDLFAAEQTYRVRS